jgi:hypothetical protein
MLRRNIFLKPLHGPLEGLAVLSVFAQNEALKACLPGGPPLKSGQIYEN